MTPVKIQKRSRTHEGTNSVGKDPMPKPIARPKVIEASFHSIFNADGSHWHRKTNIFCKAYDGRRNISLSQIFIFILHYT